MDAHSPLCFSIERGFAIGPVHTPEHGVCSCGDRLCKSPGKHPRTRNGLHDWTTHIETLYQWSDAYPGSNWGMATGAQSAVVIDTDGPEGERALADYGPLPTTLEARTAKGRHRYFLHPGFPVSNSARKLGPEIDVRGDGGYVVIPSSVHVSGARYTWMCDPLTTELAPLPETILERLRPVVRSTTPRAPARTMINTKNSVDEDFTAFRARRYIEAAGRQSEGSRNGTGYATAAFLRRTLGLGDADALAFLEAWNVTNHPPLDDRELAEVFANGLAYGKDTIGAGLESSVTVVTDENRMRGPFAWVRETRPKWGLSA